ncbi:putative zinc finger and SCAN domain-containing protein 5C [Nymphon striatum]|nr:putative zinc finger and SCAN domain-containing protein 5C [Nymphon striatum]
MPTYCSSTVPLCSVPGCHNRDGVHKFPTDVSQHVLYSTYCMICDKYFKCRKYFKAHVYNSHGERIHQCTHCKSAFKCKAELNRHFRMNHQGQKPKCDICSKTFWRPGILRTHMYDAHGVLI